MNNSASATGRRTGLFRVASLGSAAMAAGLVAHAASAQGTPQAPAAPAAQAGDPATPPPVDVAAPAAPGGSPAAPAAVDIVVTGTRLRANGYDAPTPTQVLGAADLRQTAPKTIDDFVNQIPSVSGSMTLRSRNTQASNGTNGITSPSLRSLGTQRTLVLLDGQRMVPVTQTGETDAGTIPQQLIQRIDVVTGGASALYGSDALAGVVNFVLDTKFNGLKVEATGGVTTYGDDANYRLAGTYGAKFADDRGHILVSGEYQWNKGVGRYLDRLAAGQPPRRGWQYGAPILVNNPAYSASNPSVPQFISSYNGTSNAASAGATPGGIISGVYATGTSALSLASPLVGTAFTNAGAPYAFAYGLADTNSPRQFMIGGDWRQSDITTIQGLDPYYRKVNTLVRGDYDLTDNINVFFQYQHAFSKTWGSQSTRAWIGPVNGAGLQTGSLRLASDNAYLRAALAGDPTRLALLNSVNSVTFGTFSEAEPLGGRVSRKLDRLVTGAAGKFFLGGKSYDWHINYQHGVSRNHEEVTGSFQIANFTKAIDAVVNPANGQIVCRSTLTDPNNGCVPINLVGYRGSLSPAAAAYSFGDPYRDNTFTQDVISADFAGEPVELWAGPVSLAAGIEHRREKLAGSVDPISIAGTTPQANGVPNALLGWSTNYIAINGKYDVTEGFVEAAVPLLRDVTLARLVKVDGAVRATNYSTSGYVTTWKAGLLWEPVEGIRFRASQSRDIRAPSFVELFAAGSPITLQLVDRSVTPNVSYPSVIQATVGNTSLKPEKADTTGFGVVIQPRFLPGFSFSVDYYKIKVKDAIGTVTAQTIVDQCAVGNAVFCPAIVRTNGSITQVNNQYFNFAKQDFRGLDFEASYSRQMLGGRATLRAFATRYLKAVSNDGISPPVNYLGDLGLNVLTPSIASLPKLKYRLSATYDREIGSITVIGRGASGGNWGYNQLECTTNCPATLPYGIIRTVDNNHAPASFYMDATVTVRPTFISGFEIFASVQNMFNRDPGIQPRSPAGQSFGALPTNPTVYDTLGRVFQAGVRASF